MPRAFAHLRPRNPRSARLFASEATQRLGRDREGGEESGTVPRLNRAVLDRYLEIVGALDGVGPVSGVSADTLLGLPGVVEWESEELAWTTRPFSRGGQRDRLGPGGPRREPADRGRALLEIFARASRPSNPSAESR